MKAGHVVKARQTANAKAWGFEVFDKDGALIGTGYDFATAELAIAAGNNFSDWYYS